ncbi:MAG: tetratricopeptide repeat protein [Elusimicrobiales bacterium]|nr:tetratricopeptide repeat protein [Elusimicrobiales bacterium]
MTAYKLLLLLLLAAPAAAYDRSELAEFNDLYKSGRYEEALEGYRGVIAQAPANPRAYYNAGNALFRLNRPGPAVWNYAKAFTLDPRSSDIRANLDFALRQTGQRLVPETVPAALHYVYYLLSDGEARAAAILLFWLACLAWAAAFLLDGSPAGRAAGRTGAAAAAALLLTLAWLGARSATSPFSQAGVVTRQGGARMLSGPGDTFKTYASAPEGRLVRILDAGDDAYYEIGLQQEGIKGWALKSEIDRL